jgi:hypothetical protein
LAFYSKKYQPPIIQISSTTLCALEAQIPVAFSNGNNANEHLSQTNSKILSNLVKTTFKRSFTSIVKDNLDSSIVYGSLAEIVLDEQKRSSSLQDSTTTL